MNFSIDIAIVAGYMAVCLVIGLFKYGKIKNIRDYTLGIKPFSTPVLFATTFATMVSVRYIGDVSKIYELGLVYIIPLFFVSLSWLVLAKLLAPNLQLFRSRNFISLSDIMEYWYGSTGRWVTNFLSIFLSVALTAVNTIAIGYLLHYFLGIPENTGMFVGLLIVTSYSVVGGVTSVAFTDVFQFLIFFLILPIACFIAYQNVNSIDKVWSSLPSVYTHISSEKLSLFVSLIFYGIMPYTGIAYIQRALIAKDRKQFLQSFIGVAILIIPMLVIICAIGIVTYYQNPNIAPDKALYYFVDHYLPVGIRGFMITGLLAIIMSSQDSFLNTTSTLISHDICKKINPSLTEKQGLFIARISCVFISMISISLIFMNKNIMEVIWLVDNFWDPLLTTPFIAGLLGIRIPRKSFIYVVLFSVPAVVITNFIIGEFDTRSLVVGIMTSASILYVLHRKDKKQSLLLLPKISLDVLFDSLNKRVLNNSFSISSIYQIGILLCVINIAGLSFVDLNSLSVINIFLAITSFLFICLLLNTFWSYSLRGCISHVWRFLLILSLVFVPSYILFANEFSIWFLCNLLLSFSLFIIMTDWVVGVCFILIAGSVAYLLPDIFYASSNLVEVKFGRISSVMMLFAIFVQLYNRNYIAKIAHEEMMAEMDNIAKEKNVEIRKLLNVKKEFLNKLSHEMRTPLHNMVGLSDIVYNMWYTFSDEEKRQYIKNIADSRERLVDYTSNVLDLAKLVSGRFKLKINPKVNLVEIAKKAIDKGQAVILSKNKNLNVKLVTKVSESIVACDDKRIMQVLDNLLDNAIKYSNTGVIKVIIEDKKDDILVSISDEGVGIPEKEKPDVFEPFFESSITKSPAEGKGLGLSVVQEIVIMHNGIITIKDNKPKGTIVSFSLPSNPRLR